MTKKIGFTLLFFAVIVMLLSSCGQSKVADSDVSSAGATAKPMEKHDPVTIRLSLHDAHQEVFQKYIEDALKKKYPYISIEYADSTISLADMVASGEVPDIVMPNGNLFPYLELALPTDLNELIKKNKFDLSKLEPSLIQSIKEYGPKGEVYALPADRGSSVIIYNKDIFDKFAVPYPKDGMTWEEATELAKKVTRTEDGVQYHGLDGVGIGLMKTQLSLQYFNKDGKADLSDAGWKQAAEILQQIQQIPGNPGGGGRNGFTKNKTTAMLVTNASFIIRNPVAGLNWDLVSCPTFSNGMAPAGLGSMFAITSTSKHKDDAFKVLEVYYSDEVQTLISQNADLLTISSDPAIQKQYAANNADAKKLNLPSNFPKKQAVSTVETNEDIAEPIVSKAYKDIASGNKDINTALREAQAGIDQKVKE